MFLCMSSTFVLVHFTSLWTPVITPWARQRPNRETSPLLKGSHTTNWSLTSAWHCGQLNPWLCGTFGDALSFLTNILFKTKHEKNTYKIQLPLKTAILWPFQINKYNNIWKKCQQISWPSQNIWSQIRGLRCFKWPFQVLMAISCIIVFIKFVWPRKILQPRGPLAGQLMVISRKAPPHTKEPRGQRKVYLWMLWLAQKKKGKQKLAQEDFSEKIIRTGWFFDFSEKKRTVNWLV